MRKLKICSVVLLPALKSACSSAMIFSIGASICSVWSSAWLSLGDWWGFVFGSSGTVLLQYYPPLTMKLTCVIESPNKIIFGQLSADMVLGKKHWRYSKRRLATRGMWLLNLGLDNQGSTLSSFSVLTPLRPLVDIFLARTYWTIRQATFDFSFSTGLKCSHFFCTCTLLYTLKFKYCLTKNSTKKYDAILATLSL